MGHEYLSFGTGNPTQIILIIKGSFLRTTRSTSGRVAVAPWRELSQARNRYPTALLASSRTTDSALLSGTVICGAVSWGAKVFTIITALRAAERQILIIIHNIINISDHNVISSVLSVATLNVEH